MRKTTTLAVTISSVLLGVVTAQAEPGADPSQDQQAQATSQQAQATSQTDTSRPSTTSAAPDADTATGTSSTGSGSSDQNSNNVDVGTPRSNVDEKSSSGSYYPYSAGTAGDDPSEPKSTSVPAEAGERTSGSAPTDQWMDPNADADGDGFLSQDELAKVAPTLSSRFGEMDVDGDQKLSRAEFRNWNESHKARMDADQGANSASGAQSTGSTTTPGDTSSTSGTSAIDLDSSTTPAADGSKSSSSAAPDSNTSSGSTSPDSNTSSGSTSPDQQRN